MVNAPLQAAYESCNITNFTAPGNVAERHPDKVVPGAEFLGVSVGIVLSDNGRKYTRVPKMTGKGNQTTYSQRILPLFLRRGIASPAIGSNRSFIQHSALAANP